jgi:nickel transport protein
MHLRIEKRSRPYTPWILIALGLLLALAPEASAHDFWMDRRGPDFLLVFGHGDQREEFDPAKVKTVKAFGPEGREVEVRREKNEKGLLLRPAASPSWIFAEIDNGYWSKTIYGWKNLPKRKASRVVEAIRSWYYSKALVSWSEALGSPMTGIPLDITLLKNPLDMKTGDLLPIQVFLRGKPAEGLEVEGRDHAVISKTDREGKGMVKVGKGRQSISVDYKEPLKDDPDADFLTLTSTLTFEVEK